MLKYIQNLNLDAKSKSKHKNKANKSKQHKKAEERKKAKKAKSKRQTNQAKISEKYPIMKKNCDVCLTCVPNCDFTASLSKGIYIPNAEDQDYILCNAVPYVTESVREKQLDDDDRVHVKLGFYGASREVMMPLVDCYNLKKMIDYFPAVIIDKGKAFGQIIQAFCPHVKRSILYRYIGFIPGTYRYVHSGGVIPESVDSERAELLSGETMTLEAGRYNKKAIIGMLDDLISIYPSSIIMIVLPFACRRLSTLSSMRISSKCRPVVGSSRM